jgi:enoyl-CoA hydratase
LQDGLAAGMQQLCREIEICDKPTVAAINGFALGGGCELAMACDIRIAAEHAKFGLPELNLAIIPGAGGTQRLARLVGKGRAVEMILTGRILTAQEAERIGLVTQVVSADELLAAAEKTAEQIASKGPLAVRLAKLVIQTGFETDLHSALVVERLAQTILFTTEDKVEGATAFLEKRKANFQGK